MKIKNTVLSILLTTLALLTVLGCASTPETSDSVIVQNDLIGSWEIEKPFTYKDEGVTYGKAKDTLVFSAGSTDSSLFLEVKVELTETTSDAPEGFEVGSIHSLYFNETVVTVLENAITLDAKSPYIKPSSFNFTFEEGNKSKFIWDGIAYNKK